MIVNFLNGNNVFMALPTDYGKSLCNICLPGAFDKLKCVEKTLIVVIVSPLVTLIKDQVTLYSSKGGCCLYQLGTDYKMSRGVTEGRFSNVAFKIKAASKTPKTSHF